MNGLIGAAGGRGGASQHPGAGGGGSLQSGSEALLADSFRADKERAVFRKVSIVVEANDLIAADREEALL